MKKIKNKRTLYNNKSGDTTYSMELKKLFIILGIILLVIIVLYLIIGIFVTKDIKLFGNTENVEVNSTIQYEEILAGETFNMNKDEYYVIFSDSTGNYYSIYKNIISNQTDKSIYIVDLNNPLNRSYVSDESNKEVQKASDLKVKDNTLIKINNKQNVEYIEDKDAILSYFN